MPAGEVRSVLWLSNETPDRYGQGGQRRQYFQISELVRLGHSVRVVSLAGPQNDRSIRELASVERIKTNVRGWSVPTRRWRARRLLASGRWDRAVVSHAESWSLVAGIEPVRHSPVLLDLHNIFGPWYRRLGQSEKADWYEAVEARAVAGADAVSVCSDAERDRLLLAHPDARERAIVAPLGVEPAEWADQHWSREEPIVALFGSWSWRPNADGLSWFARDVWPLVHTLMPSARALVAGTGADEWNDLQQGLEVLGRVDDLPDFLARATVVATPVKNGVGASMKFGEALASGGAVIATPDAAGAAPHAPAFVSDDPAAWAEWIVTRLAGRRQEPAPSASRDYAMRELTWQKAVLPIHEWLQQ
jgi:hypothetical protein